MISRRDLALGAFCVAGSAAAFALEPRRYVSLMPDVRLAQITPVAFGSWTSRDVSDLVAPRVEGSLESRLYDQTLERAYANSSTGEEVMVLLAHGDTQSNELQLHRPESCYPAFGFEIHGVRQQALSIGEGVRLPVRSLLADAPGRRETIVYWTRLGEFLPNSENEQRLDRVKAALKGVVADGLLARFSSVADEAGQATAVLEGFIRDFLAAVGPAYRRAFVGTALAASLARSP